MLTRSRHFDDARTDSRNRPFGPRRPRPVVDAASPPRPGTATLTATPHPRDAKPAVRGAPAQRAGRDAPAKITLTGDSGRRRSPLRGTGMTERHMWMVRASVRCGEPGSAPSRIRRLRGDGASRAPHRVMYRTGGTERVQGPGEGERESRTPCARAGEADERRAEPPHPQRTGRHGLPQRTPQPAHDRRTPAPPPRRGGGKGGRAARTGSTSPATRMRTRTRSRHADGCGGTALRDPVDRGGTLAAMDRTAGWGATRNEPRGAGTPTADTGTLAAPPSAAHQAADPRTRTPRASRREGGPRNAPAPARGRKRTRAHPRAHGRCRYAAPWAGATSSMRRARPKSRSVSRPPAACVVTVTATVW